MAQQNTVYDPDADENPLHHSASDDDLRDITGIGADEESAMDREAHNGAASDIAEREGLFNPDSGGDSKALSPSDLKEAESSPTAPNLGGGLFNEAASAGLGPTGKIVGAIASRITKKRAAAGGGIAATFLTIIVISIVGGSLEFVHLRENMLEQGNKLVNHALQERRVLTFKRIASKLHQGTLQGKLTGGPERLKAKFEKQGFKTEFDKDGKLQKLSYTSERTGETRSIDYTNEGTLKEQSNHFFSEAGFGREASRKLDLAVGSKAASWKGAASRKLYARLNVRFNNWLDRKSAQKNERDKLAENLQTQEREQNHPSTRTGQKGDTRERDKSGNLVNPDSTFNDTVGSAADSSGTGLIHEDPSPVDITDAGGAVGDAIDGKTIVGSVAKGLNAVGAIQTACTIGKNIELVRYLRNVALTTQLVRFTFNYLTVADGQKAGVISSDGLKLMALYMNTANPKTGRDALSSGGILGSVMGQSGQHPSNADIAKYSTSHKPQGFLATAQSWADKFGVGKGDTATCKAVDNGFVQVGGFAIGIVATIFTGGGFDAGNAALNIGAAAAGFVASYYAKQLLIKTATGVVLTGYEKGDEAGDALASGWGASRGMTANINGLRPITRKEAAKVAYAANQDLRDSQADQSLYARYLDTNNVNSLVSRVAFAFPSHMSIATMFSSIPRLFGSLISNLGSVLNPRGYAATSSNDSLCTDNQPMNNDIQVDDFCNPELASYPTVDIQETEKILLNHTITWRSDRIDANGNTVCDVVHTEPAPLIQADGTPISYPDGDMRCNDPTIYMSDDLLDYANAVQEDGGPPKPQCLNGRLGILYAPYKQGQDLDTLSTIHTHEPSSDPTNVCFTDGPPLSNDTSGVGRFVRYTAWYGYLVDEQNFIEQVNQDYTSTSGQSGFLSNPWDNSVLRTYDALA